MEMSTHALSGESAKTLTHLVRLRLITSYCLLTASLISVLGANWDIQWHTTIGRDRTFTPPHDMILIGIGLLGILTLINVLIETIWTRQNLMLAENSIDFLGVFHSSIGSYIVGFGAVCSGVAFPLDTYWHSLYGIDVSLWAPFHTMLYIGGTLGITGILYLFLSTSHLAQNIDRQNVMRLSNIGVVISLALLLSRLTTFIFPGLTVSPDGINLFPLLLCLCVAFVCALAVQIMQKPGTATLTIVVFVAVYFLISAFVPPMMTWLMQAEHQTYLPNTAFVRSIVVPLIGQSPWLLLTGVSVDGIIFLSRRRHWSLAMNNWSIAITAAVSTTIVAALKLIELAHASSQTISGGHGDLPFFLALGIAIPGGLLGSWLGNKVGQTMETLKH